MRSDENRGELEAPGGWESSFRVLGLGVQGWIPGSLVPWASPGVDIVAQS